MAGIIGRVTQPPDPDETAPFTHRPYGVDGDDNPYVSPSGPASQPSGPAYATPPPTPPPYSSPYVPAAPVYGAPHLGGASHKGATTSMVLGIVALSSLVLTLFCCGVTLPGVFCAPFAWVVGARARREIDGQPGVYANRSSAQAGFVMGIIGSVLGFLMIAAFVAIAVWIGVTDFSLV